MLDNKLLCIIILLGFAIKRRYGFRKWQIAQGGKDDRRCKKFIFWGIVFGLLAGMLFPAVFGGAGGSVFAAVYSVVIFPLHLFGHLFLWLSGTAIGNVPYGLVFLLLTMPATYGLLGGGLCWVLRVRKRRGDFAAND